jgi:hypothetical protein
VTAQPVVALKTAVVASLTSLLTNCQVTYGMPTDTYSDDQVIVGDAQVQVSYPTFNRQEHEIDLEIIFSSWRAGDATQQQTATEAALANYEALVAYLRSTSTNPFGLGTGLQVVQRTLFTSYSLEETAVADEALYGRLATVTATLHTCIRPS